MRFLLCGLLALASGCAEIPPGRYGVARVRLEGMEEMDRESLAACLATEERPSFEINVSLRTAEPECGQPPFEDRRVNPLRLWRWPWTDWPVYDRGVFDRDLRRVERWYRARGYYQARVVSTVVEPPEARDNDRFPREESPCEEGRDEGCPVRIRIRVREGEPVHVTRIEITGHEGLPIALRRSLRRAMVLRRGDVFDEALYDQTKTAISEQLLTASYACNEVAGWVHIDPVRRTAEVNYEVKPGPTATFGEITVEGNGELPRGPILAASQLEEGDPYDQEAIADAQRAIYALQSFTTVTIDPERGTDRCTENVPIHIRVTPARRFRGGVGAGLAAGEVQLGLQRPTSIPQWDVHLRGVFEVRNFWGGLRRLRIENRPRIIFGADFPRVRGNLPPPACMTDADCTGGTTCEDGICGGRMAQGQETRPRLGNTLEIEYREPGFPEARTTLVVASAYDIGPEPYNRYFRHDLDGRLGFERSFLRGRLSAYLGVHANAVFVVDTFELGAAPSDYHLLFLESILSLDLRDQPRDPRAGMFVSTGAHVSPFLRASSWRYYRLTPEIRLYAPLPVGLVLAGRFGVGMTFIGGADDDIAAPDDALGPDRYRLRGGGATSNRGFVPGDLGDPDDPTVPFDETAGGVRLWEASVELRARLTENFGLVAFMDMGDVHQQPTFRWNYLHTTVGFGFRYRTIVGPIRIDFGFRLPELQVVGEPDFLPRNRVNLGFVKWDGAVHITLGEAF